MDAPAFATDLKHSEIMGSLREEWSQLPASDDGEALAFAFIRKAYGEGYVRALQERAA